MDDDMVTREMLVIIFVKRIENFVISNSLFKIVAYTISLVREMNKEKLIGLLNYNEKEVIQIEGKKEKEMKVKRKVKAINMEQAINEKQEEIIIKDQSGDYLREVEIIISLDYIMAVSGNMHEVSVVEKNVNFNFLRLKV